MWTNFYVIIKYTKYVIVPIKIELASCIEIKTNNTRSKQSKLGIEKNPYWESKWFVWLARLIDFVLHKSIRYWLNDHIDLTKKLGKLSCSIQLMAIKLYIWNSLALYLALADWLDHLNLLKR